MSRFQPRDIQPKGVKKKTKTKTENPTLRDRAVNRTQLRDDADVGTTIYGIQIITIVESPDGNVDNTHKRWVI